MKRHGSMNRIYRLVWSAVRNVWIPVAEKARGRGKRSSPKLVAAALSLASVIAQASPSGGVVVSGSGHIAQGGATTTITQSTQDLSLSWTSFNIAPSETVNFVQPSASAVAVNRILGADGTQILGYLHANGQVFLINPNGIVFGPTAEVNVGGLVASTLDLNATDGASGTKSFSGSGAGSVINQGTINASQGGYVALIGNRVSNEGVISAQLGTVALGAGSAVTLSFDGNSHLRLQVEQSVLNSVAENGGLIRADGGRVLMSAGARDALYASAVNNTGVIEARTVESHDGAIILQGGATAGTVRVGGTLDASAPDGGDGGSIETSAAHVEVAGDARVTTAAPHGLFGSWLIDPQDFTIAPSGGDITGAALSANLATTGVVLQSSSGHTSGTGDVNVDDVVMWGASTTLTLTASNDVNVNANITATGNTAGLVINPNTANGGETASGAGVFTLSSAAITLSGANPSLSIAGTAYTVINTLGVAGSTTGTDLQGMNGGLSGNYALGSSINAAATSGWNGGAGFTPIGSPGSPFVGVFNGLGHSINNLTINLPTTNDVGLFGYIGTGSVVEHIELVGGSVTGLNNVGSAVGQSYYGTVRNSSATGNVSGGTNIGGLIGYNAYGTVIGSHATGNVSGDGFVGGLVGYNFVGALSGSFATGNVTGTGANIGGLAGGNTGPISKSYAAGSVSGASSVGGLVGFNALNGTIANSYATGSVSASGSNAGGLVGFGYESTVTDAYATGSVSGSSNVGGLVGNNYGSTLTRGYSIGTVSGTTNTGGLVGDNSSGTIITSYWNTSQNPALAGVGAGSATGATGLTTTQMQTATNFSGLNFTVIPDASGNNWVMVDVLGTLNNAGGELGATFPMLASEYSTAINSAHQLQLIAMALGAAYTLTLNVNAAGTDTSTTLADVWSTPGGFVPLGATNNPIFTGSFNGQGHTISGLTINLPMNNVAGLFGYASAQSVIQNVGLVGGSVTGYATVGALAGFTLGAISNSYATGSVTGMNGEAGGLVGVLSGGSINDSYATGAVTSPGTYVGGLVGVNDGTISNSHATGAVSSAGGEYVGGLVGYSIGGTISTSYATGAVSGGTYVGGIAGASEGAITNSSATGNVTGANSDVGGLVGYNGGSITGSNATTGAVNSPGGNVGGLVGYNAPNAAVSSSYATDSVNGVNSVGGLVGNNYGGMISNSYATGAVSGAAGGGSVGGLVGNNYGAATITNSHATGSVSGYSNVGGLAGSNSGTITASNASGDVSSTNVTAGGLVGNNPGGTISDSFATGTVTGSSYVGGLVGFGHGAIMNSYASGDVTSAGNVVGGLVGNYQSGTISGSHASGVVHGAIDTGGLVGKNYGTVDASYASGSTTGTNNVGGLVGFNHAMVSNSYADNTVNGNLVVGGLVGYNYTGTISNSYAAGGVTGAAGRVGGLAGNNYGGNATISNSYATGNVSGNGYGVGGLVGANGNTITTSHATGTVTDAGNGVGGLVGHNYGPVSNSYATGNVSGSGYGAGGLVGNNASTISNSYATGGVSGGNYGAGGLVGKNLGPGAISTSYATGAAHGDQFTGGLVGTNYGSISNSYATGAVTGAGNDSNGGLAGTNSGSIINSYATGNVSGGGNLAGLVGSNYGTISNTYATGSVSGTGNVGGLIGKNANVLMTSFWNSDVMAIGIGSGSSAGATGLSTAAIMTMSNFTAAGWSISDSGGSGDVWRIYQGNTAPLLLSFLTPLTVTADNTAQTYTGAPVAGLTDASYSVAGAASSGHLFNLGNAYNGAVNVGTYGPALYSDQQGYDISYVNGELTITPATLTVTANSASRIYGQANPTLSGSVTGFVGGDTLANATSGSETYSTAATATSNVGSYAIAASGLTADNGNYIFSYAAGNATAFSITPATLTVTANSASRVYGQANPTLSGSVTGFVGGDTLANATSGSETYSTAATATSNVGSYAIAASGLTADNGNYIFSYAAGNATAFSITPATLTYSAAAATFAAGQSPSGLTGTLSGFVAGDTQLTATSGSLTWTTTAGADSLPGLYAIDGGGLTARNYIFIDAAGNATALTLLPAGSAAAPPTQAPNVVTAIEANLPSSQTNIQLVMLDSPPGIAVAQSLDVESGAGAAETADNVVVDKRAALHNALLPTLRVIGSGVRLPGNEVDINAH